MKKYAAYKPSGVEWLGEVPDHWEVKRLKFVVELGNSKTDETTDPMPYVGLENIESWTGRRIESTITTEESQGVIFQPGDVLFCKLRPYLAKVHLASSPGACTSEALVMKPNHHVHAEYLQYCLLNPDFINAVDASTYGAKMPRASWDFIGNQLQLIPPLPEQRAIAAFLDERTAHLDGLIRRKEDLLKLLAEQRAALITRAVTRGLDTTAPLQDSGVPWLGQVPAHWEVKRLKFVSSGVRTGNTPPSSGVDYFDETGISWYTPGDFNSLYLAEANKKLLPEAFSEGVCNFFPAGSVLLVGIGATLGKIGLTKQPCGANQQINAILPTQNVQPDYLAYYLSAASKAIISAASASTLGILNQEKTKQIICLQPPLAEQHEIVSFINKGNKRLDKMTDITTREIEKLREYRAALITAAVTGRIDVRAAVAVPELVEA